MRALLVRGAVAAVLATAGAVLLGEAQGPEPCEGNPITVTGDGEGCGPEPQEKTADLVPLVAESGSDTAIELSTGRSADGSLVYQTRPPSDLTDAVLAIAIDDQRGTYRTFDLGGNATRAGTTANVDRLYAWAQARTTTTDRQVTRSDIVAFLADIDASKGDHLAESTRQQQQRCRSTVLAELTTFEPAFQPLVRTRNFSTLTGHGGGSYTLHTDGTCWVSRRTNLPPPFNTTWHTVYCRNRHRQFGEIRQAEVHHMAYNDDFPGLGRVIVFQRPIAVFHTGTGIEYPWFSGWIFPSGLNQLLAMHVTAARASGTC